MIQIRVLDRKIWRKDLLLEYLNDCHSKNVNAIIDFGLEGSCAEALGLYRLLDEFCLKTGYHKQRISIRTANMIEHHDDYVIVKCPDYWYEVSDINQWLKDKTLDIQFKPTKHFANFSSRSNWSRLWIATILDTYYKDKTIQTYHYDPQHENYNANGYIGVDDLFQFGCDLIPNSVEFLQTCPRTIDLDYLKRADTTDSKYQHENSYYPIQHPSNLNLLQYYNDIFVDVVVETNVSGNCFFVTEKLWRAIVARRPFVVMSNVDYLKNLHKLGFKTFSPWWSEEYDMYGSQHRIKKIELLLKRISDWDLVTLASMLDEMSETLEHNFNVFTNLKYSDISKVFADV